MRLDTGIACGTEGDTNVLKRFSTAVLFAGVMLGALSQPALADPHTFVVINDGGHQIDHVYFSAISRDTWGRDKLGDAVILPGQHRRWTINMHCEMDIKVVYHDGTKVVKADFDTCKYDLRLTY